MDSPQEAIQAIPSLEVLQPECFVHKLPFDIIHDIFRLSNNRRGDGKMSTNISHVCQRWREYALNIPTMWNSLEFRRGDIKKGWYRQKVFLERSKDAPLDIVILSWDRTDMLNVSAVSQILRLLIPHIQRWRSLLLHLHVKAMKVVSDRLRHTSASALETLSIGLWSEDAKITRWKCRIFMGGLPNLRRWRIPIQLLLPPPVSCKTDRLRELELHDSSWDDFGLRYPAPADVIRSLSRYPHLERLELKLEDTRSISHQTRPISTPLSLPNLISLRFRSGAVSLSLTPPTPSLIQICNHIYAPRINSIEHSNLGNSFIPVIGSAHPFPSLRELSLRQYHSSPMAEKKSLRDYHPEDIRKAFLNLSHLRSLTFQFQTLPIHVLETLQQHCPHLIHLSFYSCLFMGRSLVEMVTARAASESVSSLQRLTILGRIPNGLPHKDLIWLQKNVPEFNTRGRMVKLTRV